MNRRALLVVLYAAAVVGPVAAGLFRVWVHQDAVQLGYRLSEQEGRRRELVELVKQLQVELAAERSPERLMRMAQSLGFKPPHPKQVVGKSAKPAARAARGGDDG